MGDLAKEMRDGAAKIRDSSADALDTFLSSISDAIKTRDISEKKLKNSSNMDINLPKFSGHDSDMDIYTFRSEFRKLIEPFAQKCMWDEYLKKNYLKGAAYNLVSKMKNIDEIWKKLFEVYGDTRLILENKISALEKFAHLHKLKDD